MAKDTTEVKNVDFRELPPLDPGVEQVIKTELGISLWLSCCYFIFILAVPILNWTAPEFMKTKIIGGMSITWFLTAIVAMTLAFIVAWLHVYLYEKKFSTDIVVEGQDRKGVYH